MRLSVSHRSVYSFDTPVRGIVQSLRMQPTDCENQRVIDWELAVEGGQLGAAFRDGAGDWVQTLSLHDSVEQLTISANGTLEVSDLNGVLRGHREPVHPAVYLRRVRATARSRGIDALAQEVTEKCDAASPLDTAHALARAVHERVAYVQGQTDAGTTAAEALELGEGVCQDHAHIVIATAISCGIPARYVTGYLYSESGEAMSQASHAWAELHVTDLGWVGFDGANGGCPDHRYVRLGSGFDALDAAPIRGLTLGSAEEQLDVDVSVGQVQQ
ncbi:MAG: transglutaminase family protein [Pseudomonadota bacterium]